MDAIKTTNNKDNKNAGNIQRYSIGTNAATSVYGYSIQESKTPIATNGGQFGPDLAGAVVIAIPKAANAEIDINNDVHLPSRHAF